jgi:hypothetical protein
LSAGLGDGGTFIEQLAAISCVPEKWLSPEQALTEHQLARRRERQTEAQKRNAQIDYEAASQSLLELARRQRAFQQGLEQLLKERGFDLGENPTSLDLNMAKESPN